MHFPKDGNRRELGMSAAQEASYRVMVLQDAVQMQEMACPLSPGWLRQMGKEEEALMMEARLHALTVQVPDAPVSRRVRHRQDCPGEEALECSVVPGALGGPWAIIPHGRRGVSTVCRASQWRLGSRWRRCRGPRRWRAGRWSVRSCACEAEKRASPCATSGAGAGGGAMQKRRLRVYIMARVKQL